MLVAGSGTMKADKENGCLAAQSCRAIAYVLNVLLRTSGGIEATRQSVTTKARCCSAV